jgi:hypothetical protein
MLALALGIAVLSAWPSWRSMPEGTALVRLSFTHSGARECRDRTEAELAALPANMRGRQMCERRRAPVQVEVEIDGTTVLAAGLAPSGIAGSGPSRVYERFVLSVGEHDIAIRLDDDPALEGWSHAGETSVELAPQQSFVIDFRPESGGFVFR